ncbi:importin [Sporothrix brasiliensis 5110]|uniref:Importin n=1 Tax=Sporothrix brasiliensis 5110 TaxID=1398154 RepID=A0A0C2IRE5_9PEZI|nr:importin [Sporothrix brasiliensis 5110]KIH89460.1 importin [Sporothrix brasiliensis 5110]
MSFAIEVPGAAVPFNLPDLCKALQAGNSSDHSQRQAASQQLDEWQTHPNYFPSLQLVFLDRTLPYEVRFLAVILLKNGVDKYWRSSARLKGGLHPDEKALIRSRLLQGTVGEENRTLALHNALATAKVVRIDYPQDWPAALPDLVALLRSVKDTDPAQLGGGLLVLLRVIKELGSARLRRSQTALQHIAEELFYLLGDIYTANTTIWMGYLTAQNGQHGNGNGASRTNVDYAMINSLTALKVLRHLVISGFEHPHKSKLVEEFWSLTQTQFDQFLGYVNNNHSQDGSSDDDIVGKHLLKFTRLHIDMSEAHPASFAALPNSVALARAYWGIVANFADVYTNSGGLRQNGSSDNGGGGGGGEGKSSKLEGPLSERLALRGLLLLKSCIQIVTQPLKTFKYRSAEAQQDQNDGVQRIKSELFTDEFLLQVVDTIVTKLFVFRKSDLEAWEEDPEDWEAQESESGAAWEWQVRPCAERVFLSLLIHNKQLLVPPLLAYFQHAMHDETDLLTKEAVYTAMCNAAVAMGKAFDFDNFLNTTLVRDAQVHGPLAKILRRRVAILLGSWAFYELPEESLKVVYSAYAHLLNKTDPANDQVVRLTAARHLKSTVDDFQFRAVIFEPHAAGVFSALIDLLQEVESDETKLAVLATMRTFIERMETIAGQFSDGVVAALPGIWASAPEDTFMIKQAVLSILATLIMALGAASQKYHALILPLIADAMNPTSPVHQFLFEEAVELWRSIMSQSAAPLAAELVDLLPLALQVLDYDSQLVQTCLEIVNAYIILTPDAVLTDRFRVPTLEALTGAMDAKKWEIVHAASTSIQNVIRSGEMLGGETGVASIVNDLVRVNMLPRICERLRAAWEAHQSTGPNAKTSPIKPTTQVEYVLILSRIALGNPNAILNLLGSLPLPSGGVPQLTEATSGANIEAIWPWLIAEWFGSLDNMGNPESQKVACLGLTRLLEVQRPLGAGSGIQFSDLVLGRLQDYLAMWTSTVMDAQGDATKPDTYVWPEGAPPPTEFDTPLMTAEAAFVAKDPLHTQTTHEFIMARLMDVIGRVGGEGAFNDNWLVNVDRDVLAGFQALTTPRLLSASCGTATTTLPQVSRPPSALSVAGTRSRPENGSPSVNTVGRNAPRSISRRRPSHTAGIASISFRLFNLAGRKAHNQDAAVPRRALGAEVDHAYRIVDNVDAAAARQFLDRLGPVGVGLVVDGVVGAERAGDRKFVLRASGGNDLGAERLGDWSDAGSRGRRDKQAGGFRKGPAGGDGLQLALRGDDLGSIGALAGTKDAVTNCKARF